MARHLIIIIINNKILHACFYVRIHKKAKRRRTLASGNSVMNSNVQKDQPKNIKVYRVMRQLSSIKPSAIVLLG